nr:MAG TPA: hypothetical protein [Caudoviricetes sp.]
MSETVTCIKMKSLKKGRQECFDHYLVATDLYNSVIYDNNYELLAHTLQYHYDFMKYLNESLGLLEGVVDYVNNTQLESVMFKTKRERLVMENYYFCQDMKELYELVEHQYFTLKTYGIMKGEDDHDTNQ